MNIGAMNRMVTLETPTIVPDANGLGFTEVWTALVPSPVSAAIEQANAKSLDKLIANATVTQATKLVRIRFHPQVTQKTRLTWTDGLGTHVANATDIVNVLSRDAEMVIVCSELTQ